MPWRWRDRPLSSSTTRAFRRHVWTKRSAKWRERQNAVPSRQPALGNLKALSGQDLPGPWAARVELQR